MNPAPLTSDEFSAAVSAVTNAFGDPTRREIYLAVRDRQEGMTASQVADLTGLHANVARHHLDKLASGGYLTVELDRHETAGRPSKLYRSREVDSVLSFPPRRDDLLAMLLARSLDLLAPDDAACMAEDVGYEYGRSLASEMAPTEHHRSVQTAIASVADALTAHGFAAHTETRGGDSLIVAEQCPFGAAAQKYPHVVCAVDRGMIRGMLATLYGETEPCLEETRPMGDSHCVTRV